MWGASPAPSRGAFQQAEGVSAPFNPLVGQDSGPVLVSPGALLCHVYDLFLQYPRDTQLQKCEQVGLRYLKENRAWLLWGGDNSFSRACRDDVHCIFA